MAERLTECINSHLLDNGEIVKEYSLNSKIKLNHFSVMDIPNAVYDKLGELEDIMDDFHISCIDELHERLCWVEEQKKELDKIYTILEKYGTSVNELDNALFQKIISIDNPFVKGYVQAKIDAVNRAERNRDNWKRACELACEKLADIYSHCEYELFGDNVDEYRKYCEENGNPLQNIRYCETKYFYQQAKKEGEGK